MSKPRDPIALLATDTNEIMAYACPYCRNVASEGFALGGYRKNDKRRGPHKGNAATCCLCACGKPGKRSMFRVECAECAAKNEPARIASQQKADAHADADAASFAATIDAVLRGWDPVECYPLTMIHARDGLKFLAFPLDREDVPEEVSERSDAAFWYFDNVAANFGRGETPEAALADLRAKAEAVRS